MKIKIKLTTVDNVKKFVEIIRKYSTNAELQSGRYCVDAKSILGIFSLDLTKELELILDQNIENSLEKELKSFII